MSPRNRAARASGHARSEQLAHASETLGCSGAPEIAEEDVVVAPRLTEDSDLAPTSIAGGVPPGKGQIHDLRPNNGAPYAAAAEER